MSSDARMARVKAIFEEFTTHGTGDLLFAQLADDIMWRTTAPPGTPLSERFVGREGVAEYFQRSTDLVAIESVVVTDYLGGADKIVVLGRERLRLRRTGRAEDLAWAMIMSFRDDRIAEVLIIEDLSILLDGPAGSPAP